MSTKFRPGDRVYKKPYASTSTNRWSPHENTYFRVVTGKPVMRLWEGVGRYVDARVGKEPHVLVMSEDSGEKLWEPVIDLHHVEASGHSAGRSGDRLFIGIFPAGIGYADRYREVGGDYARLAFLSFRTLDLEMNTRTVPKDLQKEILAHAAKIQARRGEPFQVSASGQYVILGR